MRVLLVSALYEPNLVGGAERVAQTLAEGLTSRGHEIEVLTGQPKGPEMTREINGVKAHFVPIRNLYRPFDGIPHGWMEKVVWHGIDSFNPFMVKKALGVFRKFRPDVVHTHAIVGFSTGIWQAAHQVGARVVHTLHDYYLLCPRSDAFRSDGNCEQLCFRCRPYGAVRRRQVRHVDAFLGVSRHVLSKHQEAGVFQNGIHTQVLYNPIVPLTPEKKLGEERKLRVGYLGRIAPGKGVDLLLSVAKRLPAESTEVLIAGTGLAAYLEDLKSTYDAKHVRWLGYVPPDSLFGSVDLLVVPSVWHDPAPLVAQEAIARGLPVLASRRGGIPELVGDAGWYFEPNSPHELFHLLLRITQDRAQLRALQDKAKGRAIAFPKEAWLSAHEEIYKGTRP